MMVMGIIGGLGVFLYGIHLLKNNLEQIAGERIRIVIHRLTINPIAGILVGIIITLVFQSSSATTVLLIGLANSQLINLVQATGIIVGADIGTTLTVQIISFNIYDYSLLLIAFGVLIIFTQHKKKKIFWGQSAVGIGLVFLGMKLMSDATAPLKDAEYFQKYIDYLRAHPLGILLFSTAFTAIIQASSGTIGILISMAASGALNSLEIAIPVILGANIGTCATALLASISASPEGKRIALVHLIFKVAGVVIFYPFRGYLADLSLLTASALPHQIANAHTIFNIFITITFFPFIKPFVHLISKLVEEKKQAEDESEPKYLDSRVLETPALALAHSARELLRMADVAGDMLKKSFDAFKPGNADLIDIIQEKDNILDKLDHQLKIYISRISQESLSEGLAGVVQEHLSISINLENIGDVIDKNLMLLAKKKHSKLLPFSNEGYSELEEYHKIVCVNFDLAIAAFSSGNIDLAQNVLQNHRVLDELIQRFTENHFQRLRKGLRESIETSSIHLDILSGFHRINSYTTNCVYPIINRKNSSKAR